MNTNIKDNTETGEEEVKKLDNSNSYVFNNIRIANEPDNGGIAAEFLSEPPNQISAKELEASLTKREEALENFIKQIPKIPNLEEMLAKYSKKPSL
jgi:hypothetical protein